VAGQPVFRQQLKHINSLGPEGEEHILAMIAGGAPVREVAVFLGFPPGSHTAIYKWRDETPERRAAWRMAMTHRASALAEESLDIADGVNEDPDAIRKAELRVKVRQWLAGVSDREQYGKEQRAQLTINVGNMHLTAVEAVNREIQQKAIARLRSGAEYVPDLANALPQGADLPDADYTILTSDLPAPPDDADIDDAPEDPYADEIDDLTDLL